MNQSLSHDVIIVGGGMVGLSLAAALSKANISVALIEKQPMPNSAGIQPDSARVSAINLASEQLLTNLGAWERIPKLKRTAYRAMQVWDGLSQTNIDFCAHDVQAPHLGHIVDNAAITAALWAVLQNQPDVDIFDAESVTAWQQTEQGVHIQTQSGLTLSAQALVGCEGKHSLIRQQSGIESWSWPYQHKALVGLISHEHRHQNIARQVFTEHGPLALLPLSDDQLCAMVYSLENKQADRLFSAQEPKFTHQLQQAFGDALGSLALQGELAQISLTAQHAKRYYQGRVVVLGDAAHSIHPLAGLGVNIGFLDVATLAEQWTSAKQQQLDFGHAHFLRRYQRKRAPHNYAIGGLMEGFKRLYGTQSTWAVLSRNTGLRTLQQTPLAKRPIIQAALGEIGPTLPPLCRPS